MVHRRTALAAALGVVLFGSFLLAPATDPPDQYAVTVQVDDHVTDPTPYSDLSADYQRAFDAARTGGGTNVYRGAERPANVAFPEAGGLTSRTVSHQDATYLVQFTHDIESPDAIGILRTLASLAGGVSLLAYAGYRQFNE